MSRPIKKRPVGKYPANAAGVTVEEIEEAIKAFFVEGVLAVRPRGLNEPWQLTAKPTFNFERNEYASRDKLMPAVNWLDYLNARAIAEDDDGSQYAYFVHPSSTRVPQWDDEDGVWDSEDEFSSVRVPDERKIKFPDSVPTNRRIVTRQ